MRWLTYASMVGIAVLLGLATDTYARNHQIPFDSQHFFYHDEKNVMQRMQLVPKIGVRFLRDVAEDETKKFLARFSFFSQSKDSQDSRRIWLGFPAHTKHHEIMRMLSEVAASDIAEATPVFLINNIEAIVDGIMIEPKIILSPNDIERRIKRLGEFTLGAATLKEDVWMFPVTNIKPPLNLFILINLIHGDEWMRRAYPSFRYLHDPITSVLKVHPVSGTVNELRTLTLSIRAYNSKIAIDEKLLPTFGEGKFMPAANNKLAPPYLFEVIGEREAFPNIHANQGRELVYSWKFAHYAIGEWTIPPQPIAYTINGTPRKIDTPSATLVVTSLIGQLAINDIPAPHILSIPGAHPAAGIQGLSLPSLPVYWFDAWIADIKPILAGITWALYAIGAVSFFICALLVNAYMRGARAQRRIRKQFQAQMNTWLQEAKQRCSYAPLAEATYMILARAFPHLGRHQEYRLLKEDERVCRVLGQAVETLMQPLFEELNRMYGKDAVITASDIDRTLHLIRSLQLLLEPLIQFSEEEGYGAVA